MTKLFKILFFASLVINANLTGAAEKPNDGFFSKVSQKYKDFRTEQKDKKEKNKVIKQIFDYCLNHAPANWNEEVGISPQMYQLENNIKQNPWALETKNKSWTIKQVSKKEETPDFGDWWLRYPVWNTYETNFRMAYADITSLQRAVANFQYLPWITTVKEIETLVNLGANVNVKGKEGNTPILNVLDLPVKKANVLLIPIVFKMLLDKNADLTVINKFGETVTSKINKLPEKFRQILFGLIESKQTKPEATKVLNAHLPSVISNLIGEYMATDNHELELDAQSREILKNYARFYDKKN